MPGLAWSHVELLQICLFAEGASDIQAAIHSLELNRVVVAACSNRTHDSSVPAHRPRSAGLNPYLLELVNSARAVQRVHHGSPS
jgi:heterodisulfide reductase subunit A-like polyferredoxin